MISGTPCFGAGIDADQGADPKIPLNKLMERDSAITAIAYKMIESFGDQAAERMRSIVTAHIEAQESDGAAFWGDISRMVERLQAAISVAKEPQANSQNNAISGELYEKFLLAERTMSDARAN
jgi:hypothetical protein